MTDQHPGRRLVGGAIVDMGGVPRVKYVPATRTDAFRSVGMGASPSWSVFCVDGAIAFTPTLGVVGDLRIRIDLDDLREVAPGVAVAAGDLGLQDGRPSPMCARTLLRDTVARATESGLRARLGAEIECTLLDASGGHATGAGWAPYGLGSSLRYADLLVDLVDAAERAGVGIEQLHPEYGPDQLEVSLAPADPVRAIDDVVVTRAVIARVAARHGLRVSFSPLPFPEEAGNGAHLHLSLAGDAGPLFSGGSGPHGLSAAGGAAIAGVLEALPDLIGVYAGSVLSEHRLQPDHWAGAAACWGLENREAAVRLVTDGPGSAHGANIELKVVDPSGNPYLAAAAFLGSALNGVRRSLTPADPVDVHPATSAQDLPPLPTTQRAALQLLATSRPAVDLLGEPIVEGVLAVRRHEAAAFAGRPLGEVAEALRLAWS